MKLFLCYFSFNYLEVKTVKEYCGKKKIDRGLTRVHFNLNKVKLVEESDFHNVCSEYRDWPI